MHYPQSPSTTIAEGDYIYVMKPGEIRVKLTFQVHW